MSVGGMGDPDGKGARRQSVESTDQTSPGKAAGLLAGASGIPAASTSETSEPQWNYQPTAPANLSRRRLHQSGVGYLDPSLPLILSAMSDRFIATVLVQAMACRDRRIEGHKASLKERRERKRHRRRVARERNTREGRFQEEMGKRRTRAEAAVEAAKHIDPKKVKTAAGSSSKAMFGLGDKEKREAAEYKKMNADVDAEEDYYDKYYGESKGGDDEDMVSDEDDDEDDDLPDDGTLYDLKLRDLVRPLAAWGFDLTGKLGFEEEAKAESDGEDDEIAEAGDGSDDDEDSEEDSDDEDDGGATTDDEGGGSSPKKRKAPSPKKKKRPAAGAKKKAAAVKKKAAKRKRDEKEGEKGAPQAKKSAAGSGDKPKADGKKAEAKSGDKKESGAEAKTTAKKGAVVNL